MLSHNKIVICHNTISANAFLWLVRDAIERHADLSIVREADGEKKLLAECRKPSEDPILCPFPGFDETWLKKYGCWEIPRITLENRIVSAALDCTYFAPSISGITMPAYDLYDLFPERERYVDNFFPNLWNEDQKIALFKLAGHVLFIHGNRKLADAMQQRAKYYHGVKVSYLPLSNWEQAPEMIRQANEIAAPLTVFSAGPASKYIGPRIHGVTLDIGAAAPRWTFAEEFERCKQAAEKAGRLEEFTKSPYTYQETKA